MAEPLMHAEPETFAFDSESEPEVTRAIAKYPEGRQASATIALLYTVQEQMRRVTGSGWVPRAGMDAVAARLKMAPIRVYEIATFYTMFNLKPVGKWHLQICTTTPCWLRGSDEIVATCRAETGITGWGDISADGLFSMSEVECLGACVNAPMMQINNENFYEDLDGKRTKALLDALRRDELPKPGSMSGRQTSAPEGGPNTLTTLRFAPGT